MILFIVLCFVGTIGVVMQKLWGYIVAALVSFGFIIGSNLLDAWVPRLMNPNEFGAFMVADTIVPTLVLVAVFTVLCMINRKNGLNHKKYLTSGRSLSGVLTIVIIILAIAGAAIGASTRTASSATSGTASVTIVAGPGLFQQHFVPATITVVIGVNNTVIWTNNDSIYHTVTSYTSVFNSGLLNSGNSWNYTFTTPGTYNYHCTLHLFMTGSVIVIS